MSQHHPRSCLGYPGSYALLSDGPTEGRIATVFVHGFAGDSFSTWLEFHTLVDSVAEQFPLWQNHDLYFFDYGSVYTGTPILAARLQRFLDHVYPEPDVNGLGIGPSKGGMDPKAFRPLI